MTEKHRPGADGLLEDGVSFAPATPADLAAFPAASEALSGLSTPRLLGNGNAHARLFVACFDGTWNDMEGNPEHKTNVALAFEQIVAAQRSPESRVAGGYVKGVGTQKSFIERTLDGAIGYTYDDRLEQMYAQFIDRAKKWLREDPQANISIAELGFSRGAEQAAGFARLVHERGIQDPDGIRVYRDDHGRQIVEYTKPPLVPPGQTAQALALIDPVGTGEPRQHDRRPPPSVVSGFQIVARDEKRNLFKSTSILDPGFSEFGRFLSVTVPGAHSNLGGAYHHDGLSIRTGNLMVDYLNSLSDRPFLQKTAEPTDPRRNVIHRSEEGMWFYRTSDFDRDGLRDRIEQLAPRGTPGDRFNAEPRDEALAARFAFAPVAIGPTPRETPAPPRDPAQPGHPAHAIHTQLDAAASRFEATLPGTPDATTQANVRAHLLLAAREAGLQRVDHVVRSEDGKSLFAVEGEPTSPLKRAARVDLQAAVTTPADDSLRRLDAREATRESQGIAAPHREAPALTEPAPSRLAPAL